MDGLPPAFGPAKPDELDLDAWINGTCGMTASARVYQRGDLQPELDRLNEELALARKAPKGDRGANDIDSADALQKQWEDLAEQWNDSALTVFVQDRTEVRRQSIRDRVSKEFKLDDTKYEDRDTLSLHVLADAIVRVEQHGRVKQFPDGMPPNQLRAMRDRLGDSALLDLWDAFNKVTSEAPHVSAPLSQPSSSNRGGIT